MNEATQSNPITTYISNQPKEVQLLLKKVRATIKSAAPKASETMSYGIPTFDYPAPNHQSEHLVHFAAFKKHIGFFPTPKAILEFKNELTALGLKTSKGTVQFPFEIFASSKSSVQAFSIIKKMTSWRMKVVAKNGVVSAKANMKAKNKPKTETKNKVQVNVKAKVKTKTK